jgi:hypothetical protein
MSIISTQGFTFRLLAEGTNGYQQLDIFDDEDITISNNITGLFDIGVLPSDFTRDISLPGSKINNAFFEHMYDISIENPYLFATNKKVSAYFDFDSVYLSQGYLQLNSVNVKANKFIESYNVTIYGALSSFGRDVSRAFLTDLDNLSIYNHTASYENISSSWGGHLFNGDIVYPLADYGTGWQYTNNDIFFGLDDTEGGMSVGDFKPAIRIKPVLDAIFDYAGYTYTSSFFNQDFIDDIYLLCNNSLKYPEFAEVNLETYGVAKWGAISGSGMTDVVLSRGVETILPWYNVLNDPSNVVGGNGSYTIPRATALRGVLNLEVSVSGSLGGPNFDLYINPTGSGTYTLVNTLPTFGDFFVDNTNALRAQGATGQNRTYTLATEFNTSIIPAGTYNFAIEWNDIYTAPFNNFRVTMDPGGNNKSFIEIRKSLQAANGRIMDIASNMPFGTNGIKMIDFVLGLQKKYNLVIYPSKTNPKQFIIETFNDWYKKGERKDFNKYINLDNTIEVVPANNLAVNELNFGDTLDQDYISQQFSKGNNREFGKTYYTDTENFFSQGTFEVKTTFSSAPLLRLPGTGLSGSVGGLNPPPSTCATYTVGPVFTSGYAYWTDCAGGASSTYIAIGQTTTITCARIGSVSGNGSITYINPCN